MTGRRVSPDARKEDLRRLARLLGHKIRDAGLTLREVSERMGWPPDRLSHVLKGRLLLRLEDLYGILDVLALPPSVFFAEVERTAPRPEADPWLRGRDPNEVLLAGVTRGDLFAAIRRAVQEEIAVREDRRQATGPRRPRAEGAVPGEEGLEETGEAGRGREPE